jgi:hypothetical protein
MPMKQVFVTALTDVWTTASDGDPLGVLRWEVDATYGTRLFKCVKLLNVTAAVVVADGDALNYVADTGPALHQVCSDVDDAGTQRLCAGVALAAMAGTLLTSYFCWVQVTGFKRLNTAIGGTPGDGDPLTTDGAADLAMDKAATIEDRCATCIDATDKDVMLHCRY